MPSPVQRFFRLGQVAALIAAAAVVGLPTTAAAAVPVIHGPDRVFTTKNMELAFTGTELLAAPTSRVISVDLSTTDEHCVLTGDAPDTSDCGSVKLDVNHGLLRITLEDGMSTVGNPTGSATLQFQGTQTQINNALKTLVFTPDSDYVNDKNSNDGTPPAILQVNAIDGVTGDSTISGDASYFIEIRVDTVNQFPSESSNGGHHPAGPITVTNPDTVLTDQFSVADPDINRDTNKGKMLLIAWVDCGTFSVNVGGFTLGDDLKTLMINQGGLDSAVADAIYDVLPNDVKNLSLATSGDNVSAIAGVGELDDVNYLLSQFTFHHPLNVPQSCTFTQVVDDLGFRGLPGQYVNFTHPPNEYPTGIELPAMGFDIPQVTFVIGGGAVPDVTIEQASGQADPTSTGPIEFTATFSDDVAGFGDDPGDVVLTGTAGATTATVTPVDAKTYTVSVTGMTQSGTVIATVPADAAQATVDPQNGNTASTSMDNTVTYQVNAPAPSVTVDQGSGQVDPASVSPVVFDVVFSEGVSGFTAGDVVLSGTAGATTATVTPVDASRYTVSVSGMTQSGTVVATVPAGAALSVATSQASLVSTSSDNTVEYVLPVSPAPSVTVDQGSGQVDPVSVSPVVFDVVFSEGVSGFTAGDVALSGTAGATTATVTSVDASRYTVSVSGMTQSGTVVATVPAGAALSVATLLSSLVSTSTDNTVEYVLPVTPAPSVTVDQGSGQVDPVSVSPVVFDVVFSEGVSGFTAGDVALSGTAGATTATVTSVDASRYTVSVSGMTQSGTVVATVPAGAALSVATLLSSLVSTSTDNTVEYVLPDGSEPLTIQIPPDETVPNDPGLPGAVVAFPPATSTGGLAPVTVSCDAASGDFFPLGSTLVTCTATDSAQPDPASVSGSFTITVVDTEAPVISHPDVTVHTTDPNGAVVDYGAPAASDNSGVVTVVCDPLNNTLFPIGDTPVTCTATDPTDPEASVTFFVHVILDTIGATDSTTPSTDTSTTTTASTSTDSASTSSTSSSTTTGSIPPGSTSSGPGPTGPRGPNGTASPYYPAHPTTGGYLSYTGADLWPFLGAALLLLTLGLASVLVARRRPARGH